MSEFKGDVGTIYTESTDVEDEKQWEAWFEDFHIIGLGRTELEALRDAERVTRQVNELVKQAIARTGPRSQDGRVRVCSVNVGARDFVV